MAEYLRAVGGRREFATALSQDELTVHFQPVVGLQTGAVRGVEALLRWHHPEQGLLPAGAFLPAFENSPVMKDVTRFVLTTACNSVAHGAPPTWTVSVNVTAADSSRNELVDEVSSALADSGLPAERLVLEVTETGLLSNYDDATRVLGRLRDLGVTISLDDFGTGYSSLRLLRELPISELKIDALFVAEVETQTRDSAIVGNVIRLAESFGATVVAEGVERLGQAAFLQQLGCGFGQGYLWSRPMPLENVLEVVPVPPHLHGRQRPPKVVGERVQQMVTAGASHHSVAAALNAEGLRTPDGKRWHPSTVATLLRLLAKEPPQVK